MIINNFQIKKIMEWSRILTILSGVFAVLLVLLSATLLTLLFGFYPHDPDENICNTINCTYDVQCHDSCYYKLNMHNYKLCTHVFPCTYQTQFPLYCPLNDSQCLFLDSERTECHINCLQLTEKAFRIRLAIIIIIIFLIILIVATAILLIVKYYINRKETLASIDIEYL
jgi:hypothetical protein